AGTYSMNSSGYTRDLSSSLGGGTHQLTATYSGDGSYLGSSAADTITITPAATSLQFTAAPSSVKLGAQVQLNLLLSTQVPGVAATGTVTFFYDGATPLAATVVNTQSFPGAAPNSFASMTFFGSGSISVGGAHVITAKYSGDANYQAATITTPIQVLYV